VRASPRRSSPQLIDDLPTDQAARRALIRAPSPGFPICEIYFGLESGGQSGRASMGFSPLCTVGAADFEPPASGRTALFSTAMEFDVLSSALPDVAAVEVVQLVSCFSLDGVVDCASAGPTTNDPKTIAAPTRLIIFSRKVFINQERNVSGQKRFRMHFAAGARARENFGAYVATATSIGIMM